MADRLTITVAGPPGCGKTRWAELLATVAANCDLPAPVIVDEEPAQRPNIQRLWEAIVVWENGARAVRSGSILDMTEGFQQLNAEFLLKLQELGIADHFDWSDENG